MFRGKLCHQLGNRDSIKEVISRSANANPFFEIIFGNRVHDENGPSARKDNRESIAPRLPSAPIFVWGASHDFNYHLATGNGQVDVSSADRILPSNASNADNTLDVGIQFEFIFPTVAAEFTGHCLSQLDLLGNCFYAALGSPPSTSACAFNVFLVIPGSSLFVPGEKTGGTIVPDGDVLSPQPFSDSLSANAESQREISSRGPGVVISDERVDIAAGQGEVRGASNCGPGFFEPSLNCMATDSVFPGQINGRAASSVFPHKNRIAWAFTGGRHRGLHSDESDALSIPHHTGTYDCECDECEPRCPWCGCHCEEIDCKACGCEDVLDLPEIDLDAISWGGNVKPYRKEDDDDCGA